MRVERELERVSTEKYEGLDVCAPRLCDLVKTREPLNGVTMSSLGL
jgi:hypothetical protein